jgi:hypothetical protein
MAKQEDMVPPFSCSWGWFLQATDPATDPNNHIGPGKLWIETDDDLAPTQVVGAHVRSVDDSGWLDLPIGTAAHTYIAKAFIAAKGDLIGASANDTPLILSVGTNGFVRHRGLAGQSDRAQVGDLPTAATGARGGPTPTTWSRPPTARSRPSGWSPTPRRLSGTGPRAGRPRHPGGAHRGRDGLGRQQRHDHRERRGDDGQDPERQRHRREDRLERGAGGEPDHHHAVGRRQLHQVATTAYADNAVAKQKESSSSRLSDETTTITTGTAKVTFGCRSR